MFLPPPPPPTSTKPTPAALFLALCLYLYFPISDQKGGDGVWSPNSTSEEHTSLTFYRFKSPRIGRGEFFGGWRGEGVGVGSYFTPAVYFNGALVINAACPLSPSHLCQGLYLNNFIVKCLRSQRSAGAHTRNIISYIKGMGGGGRRLLEAFTL